MFDCYEFASCFCGFLSSLHYLFASTNAKVKVAEKDVLLHSLRFGTRYASKWTQQSAWSITKSHTNGTLVIKSGKVTQRRVVERKKRNCWSLCRFDYLFAFVQYILVYTLKLVPTYLKFDPAKASKTLRLQTSKTFSWAFIVKNTYWKKLWWGHIWRTWRRSDFFSSTPELLNKPHEMGPGANQSSTVKTVLRVHTSRNS